MLRPMKCVLEQNKLVKCVYSIGLHIFTLLYDHLCLLHSYVQMAIHLPICTSQLFLCSTGGNMMYSYTGVTGNLNWQIFIAVFEGVT
jgi:hypothetical protein